MNWQEMVVDLYSLHDAAGNSNPELINTLFEVIKKQVSDKTSYITRSILFSCEERIALLLDCPDLLAREVSHARDHAARRRTSR